jgi:hypothetical protein
MKGITGILFSLLLITAFACSKGGTNEQQGGNGGNIGHDSGILDTIAPVLVVNTPTENQEFISGNSIAVSGNISDDLGLYQGSIRITNDATGAVLKEQLYEVHYILSYNFNVPYTPTVSAVSNYTVTVSFMDHGFNVATKSVKIKVNP